MKLSVSHLFFILFIFIYLFIYIYRAAKFMRNINIIPRSFSPTALFPSLAGCLSFSLPCPACFLALPISSGFCLFPCPAYFCALPISLPCLCPCPAYVLALPLSLPCLLPCPTYRSTFFMSARCTGASYHYLSKF